MQTAAQVLQENKITRDNSTPNLPNKSPKENNGPSFSEFERYGVPPRFAGKGPDLASDERTAAQSVKDTVEIFRGLKTPKKGLLILGERGTGKTTQVCEIAKAAIGYCLAKKERLEGEPSGEWVGRAWRPAKKERVPTVKFVTFWQFIADLRKSYKEGTPYARELAEADIIFLDDLGKVETNRDWFIEAFQEFVDNLYNEKPESKLLYITSNLSGEEIAATFGEPCKDRLDTLCYTIKFEGRSLRD